MVGIRNAKLEGEFNFRTMVLYTYICTVSYDETQGHYNAFPSRLAEEKKSLHVALARRTNAGNWLERQSRKVKLESRGGEYGAKARTPACELSVHRPRFAAPSTVAYKIDGLFIPPQMHGYRISLFKLFYTSGSKFGTKNSLRISSAEKALNQNANRDFAPLKPKSPRANWKFYEPFNHTHTRLYSLLHWAKKES